MRQSFRIAINVDTNLISPECTKVSQNKLQKCFTCVPFSVQTWDFGTLRLPVPGLDQFRVT